MKAMKPKIPIRGIPIPRPTPKATFVVESSDEEDEDGDASLSLPSFGRAVLSAEVPLAVLAVFVVDDEGDEVVDELSSLILK